MSRDSKLSECKKYMESVGFKVSKSDEKNMSVSELFKSRFEVDEDSDDEFNGDKCMDYSLAELRNFARQRGIRGNHKKSVFCDKLALSEMDSLWDKCMSENIGDIRKFAEDNGYSSAGTKKQICNRIFRGEVQKYEEKYPCINDSKIPLHEYQKRVVRHMLNNRGLIVVHGTGRGKTLSCVTSIHCVLQQQPDIKVVILTPTSLQENMKKEFIGFGANPNHKSLTFSTIDKFVRDRKAGKYRCKNTFLIVDEAHNLKSYNSERAKEVIGCAKRCNKVLLLTATPVLNRPDEIVNLVAMVDGTDPIPPSTFNRIIMGHDNEFKRYFKCKVSVYDSERNAEDFPKVNRHNIHLIMDKNYYRKYRKIEMGQSDGFTARLFGSNKNLQSFYNGVRRAANNLESKDSPKVNWIIDKIKSENKKNKNNKTVIFSSFLDAGSKLVMKRLDEEGIPYVKIDGSMSIKSRKASVDDFNSGETNILFISEAGGAGLDLKGGRHLIVMEPPWNAATLEQVEGRINRFRSHSHLPPKERRVDYWYLYTVKPDADELDEDDDIPAIDEILRDMAAEKKEEINDFLKRLEEVAIESSPTLCKNQ